MNKGQKLTFAGKSIILWPNSGTIQALMLSLLLGIGFSCGTSKKLGKDSNLSSTELLVRRLETKQIKAKTFDGRAKIDFRSTDMSASATIRIRMQKDSSIWVTLSKLGFEVGRAFITSDSVHILDRINNEYTVYALDYLSKEYQLPGNLLLIQQVILGNPFFLSRNFTSTSAGDRYLLNDSGSGKEIKMSIETNALRLRNFQYLEPSASRSLNLDLEEYNAANDKQDFSYLRKFVVDSRETGKVEVNIQFTQVELNVPISMPFDVPQRFKRVK
ncbi:hypothetical protein Halhy_3010 [Haliscomenobacter hydrossis DSM 1100]|uniref:Deoxyuridine 5'-triphosphate nucleotidohydrolase n=2 Tax=Haliscomenobacter TaxID=2349 RepID=F4L6P2_HALH1|nr:hypothetical protein Halhy_3010 [Haliscomenobacter hydrossis DSM 1100]